MNKLVHLFVSKDTQHGILQVYHQRLTVAVSVFHAYGHQWPCQILFHPRKCKHFGLSDGEGCERFWSSIKRLIPSMRVSGVSGSDCLIIMYMLIYHIRAYQAFHRRWTLDRQFIHTQTDNLRLLGRFLVRRRNAALKRLTNVEEVLGSHRLDEALLRCEWEHQVQVQTEKLTRKNNYS